MKNFTLLVVLGLTLSLWSCRDACDAVQCLNDGVCIDGDCACADFYEGDRCQIYNPEGVDQDPANDGSDGHSGGGCSDHGNDNDPYKE